MRDESLEEDRKGGNHAQEQKADLINCNKCHIWNVDLSEKFRLECVTRLVTRIHVGRGANRHPCQENRGESGDLSSQSLRSHGTFML
jgi:hypothetical protein